MKYLTLLSLATSLVTLQSCSSSSESAVKPAPQLSAAPIPAANSKPQLIDSYTTHISEKDKVTSKGTKLTLAQDIILQDRKNYYDFNRRDPADTPSKVFAEKQNRWGEGTPVSEMKWEPVNSGRPEQGYRWTMRKGVEYEIIEGNPDLKIQIYNDGNIHVNPHETY